MINVYEELAESSRRSILAELRAGAKNVGQLVKATGLKQPNVSNHLARMRSRGVVKADKVGREVYYSIASPEIAGAIADVLRVRELPPQDVDLAAMAKQFAKAATNGDEGACSDILDRAFRAQLSLLEIYNGLLAPAMNWVGTWYEVEAIDEAQEHMASAITERMMAKTVQLTGPQRRSEQVAILGCAEGSWHVIGLRMIGDLLRVQGWKTLYLGANVPTPAFVSSVRQHRPDLVLVSCGAEEAVEQTKKLVEGLASLKNKKNQFLIGIGGSGTKNCLEECYKAGADFSASDLSEFSEHYLQQLNEGSLRIGA